MQTWTEFPDGVTHAIQTVFPNFVVQQIQNSLALRLMVPKGIDACELQWLLSTITGIVDRDDQREAAEKALRVIPGVTSVLNEIVVRRPVPAAGV